MRCDTRVSGGNVAALIRTAAEHRKVAAMEVDGMLDGYVVRTCTSPWVGFSKVSARLICSSIMSDWSKFLDRIFSGNCTKAPPLLLQTNSDVMLSMGSIATGGPQSGLSWSLQPAACSRTRRTLSSDGLSDARGGLHRFDDKPSLSDEDEEARAAAAEVAQPPACE
jgi:hypothetical protein